MAVADFASHARAFCTHGLFRDAFLLDGGSSAAESVAFDQRVAFRTLQANRTAATHVSAVPTILRVVINRAGPDGFSIGADTPLLSSDQHDDTVASADRCLRDVVQACLLDVGKNVENVFFDLGGSRYFVMLKLIEAPLLKLCVDQEETTSSTMTSCDNDA